MAAVTSAAFASLLAAASLRERALRKLRHERSLLQVTANSQLPSHILLSPSVHIKDAAHIQQLAVSDDALLRALGDFLQGDGPKVSSQDKAAFSLVNSAESFCAMCSELALSPWLSIDVEHHSTHSFHGFVCLIQISTEARDFIIDPLCPTVREALLDPEQSAILRELLLSPACLKILHGCDNDMAWLATNFNLYFSGILDTAQLAKATGASSRSLAVLLKRHFGVKVNKEHQLADWRQRPLPPKLITYARGDTRHLAQLAHALGRKLLSMDDPSGPAMGALVSKGRQLALSAHSRQLGTTFSPSRWLRTWSRWLARSAADAALREESSPLAPAAGGGGAAADAPPHRALMTLKGVFPVPSDALQALAQLPRLAFVSLVASELRHAVAVAWDEGGDAVQSQGDTLMAALAVHACTTDADAAGTDAVGSALGACLSSDSFAPKGPFSASNPLRPPPACSSGTWNQGDIALAGTAAGLRSVFTTVLARAAQADVGSIQAALDVFAVQWWEEQQQGSDTCMDDAADSGADTPCGLHEVLRRRHTVGPTPPSNTPAAREAAKAERWAQISHNYSRKHLYDSCELLNVDGSTLAFIERRRADWYVRKGLATLEDDGMGEEPQRGGVSGGGAGATSVPTRVDDELAKAQKRRIVLKLVRPARGGGATQYNNMPKSNLCVRCGDTELLSKFYVVPRAFRQRFPEDAKSHSCHDVVLLCATCRRIVEPMYARLLKAQAREWGLTSGMYSIHGPSGLLMSDLDIQVPAKPKKKKTGPPQAGDTPPPAASSQEGVSPTEHFERLAVTLRSTQHSCESAIAIMGQRAAAEDFSSACSAVVWSRLPGGLRDLLHALTTLQPPSPSEPRAQWCDVATACGFEDPVFLLAAQGSCSFGRVQTSLRQLLGQTRSAATASQVVRSALTLAAYLANLALHLPVFMDGSVPGLLPSLGALFRLASSGALELLGMPDASRRGVAVADMSTEWGALPQEVQQSDMCHSLRSTLGASKAEEKFTATMVTRWRDAVGNFVSSFTTDPAPHKWLPTHTQGGDTWAFEQGVGRAAVTQQVPAEPTHHGTPIVPAHVVAAIMHGVPVDALSALRGDAGGCAAVHAAVLAAQQQLPPALSAQLGGGGAAGSAAGAVAAGAGAAADPAALEELDSYLAKHTLHVPQAALVVHYTLYPREQQLRLMQERLNAMPPVDAAEPAQADGLQACDTVRSGQSARHVARQLAAAPPLPQGVVYVPASANRPYVPPHLPEQAVQDRLHGLVHKFRDFFLQSVQPQHMPEGWHTGLEVFLPGKHKHHRMPPRASDDVELPHAAQAWREQ